MKFFIRLAWLFAKPARLLEEIREHRVPWWQPWIALSAVSVVVEYLGRPIQYAVLETNPNDLPLDALQRQLSHMETFGALQLVSLPVALLFLALTVSGIAYLVVSLLSEKSDFRRYFTIALYQSIIASIGQAISILVIRSRGLEGIRTPDDASFTLSLRLLDPDAGALLRALLSSFELFSLWGLVFLAFGLVRVFEMSRARALASVLPWWVLFVLLTVVGQLVGAIA